MENLPQILSGDSESDPWVERAKSINAIEHVIECAVFSITAIFGLYVLFKVVIMRKFYDFFAIALPLQITCFAIMVVEFDIATKFEGLQYWNGISTGYVIAIWIACSLYGGFHLLFSIHYLQSSVTLKKTHQYAILLKKYQYENQFN